MCFDKDNFKYEVIALDLTSLGSDVHILASLAQDSDRCLVCVYIMTKTFYIFIKVF